MEDSPTDSPDLWMPERNEEDTMFERSLRDVIPTKKHPESVSELSIVQQRKKLFKDLVKGCNETLTLSVTDQYLEMWPNDLEKECSHLSKWQGVGKQAEASTTT